MLSILRTTECTYSESDFESRIKCFCRESIFRNSMLLTSKIFVRHLICEKCMECYLNGILILCTSRNGNGNLRKWLIMKKMIKW